MTATPERIGLPRRERLDEVCRLKYGDPASAGWGPRLRRRFGYYNPDDVYEAIVAGLVEDGARWLDVGCGRDLFPCNRELARRLASRCGRVVGVDPAPTLAENDLLHERVHTPIDEYRPELPFDLVTMRMVAEHVDEPEQVVRALARCARSGGHLVVYTVHRWSPVPMLTSLVPFAWRHPIKRWLWGTEEKDTFPTRFKMNTRARLRAQLGAAGFAEVGFVCLDDCRTTARFRALQCVELSARSLLRRARLRYPEICLLGIYRKS